MVYNKNVIPKTILFYFSATVEFWQEI